jgi:hypothetical protein
VPEPVTGEPVTLNCVGRLKPTLVTLPEPLPVPQAVPVLLMYPLLSICRQLWPLDVAKPGKRIEVEPVKAA